MNPGFVLRNVGKLITFKKTIMKAIKVILFILFMLFGLRQFFIFNDIWAGTFLSVIGISIALNKKEDVL